MALVEYVEQTVPDYINPETGELTFPANNVLRQALKQGRFYVSDTYYRLNREEDMVKLAAERATRLRIDLSKLD